jgi:ribosomal protein L35
MPKTNKSFTKRLRKTSTGKLVQRVPGQNHFNAKESQSKRLQRKRSGRAKFLNAKQIGQYL